MKAELPNIELVSEKVHEAWMVTKTAQGFHAPNDCPSDKRLAYQNSPWLFKIDFEPKNHKWCDKCHTCLYPYNELSEQDKELDRSTVKAVYSAIEQATK